MLTNQGTYVIYKKFNNSTFGASGVSCDLLKPAANVNDNGNEGGMLLIGASEIEWQWQCRAGDI